MIGDLLRAERERQNLSFKDVERGTSIRSLYIEAIEKGEYKTLPGEVYTKGFIRNYANFLKLDCSLIKNTFGWKPRWHVETAMEKIVEWTAVYFDGKDISEVMNRQIAEFLSKDT